MAYLGAKRILEHHCYKIRHAIDINLLEMRLPLFPQPSWLELQCIMQNAVSYHGKPIDPLVKTRGSNAGGAEMPSFFQYIEGFVRKNLNVIDSHGCKIFRTFVDIIAAAQPETVTTPKCDSSSSMHYISLHCETILAALADCVPDIISQGLAQIVKVQSTDRFYDHYLLICFL